MKPKTALIGAAIILIVLAAAIAVWALQDRNNAGLTRLNAHQYAFLEHYTETRAELVGTNGSDAYVYLGYPTYNASQSSELIKNRFQLPPVNDSLRAIFQEGSGVGKAGCHGTQMNISGIYRFPYDSDRLRILTVDGDGVAYIVYKGQPVILNPNEVWYDNQTITETVLANKTLDQTVQVNLTIIDRIRNYGIYEK